MAGAGGGLSVLTGPAAPATGRRGRGPAAPAINSRTVTEFEDVTSIPFVFARHPICAEAHIHVNNVHSDGFMDAEDLFAMTAPPTRDAFVADPVAIVKWPIHRRCCWRLLPDISQSKSLQSENS